MRGISTIRRIGVAAVAAGALGAAAAAPVQAATMPACATRLVAAPAGTTATCHFDTPYDYANITVVADRTVKVTTRCLAQYGYTFVRSWTLTGHDSRATWTPGGCALDLTAVADGVNAHASAVPTTGPIIEPYPVP